jgi:hypothetical protein
VSFSHTDVFVFAGAGISRVSGLPLFSAIRDGALASLDLLRYVQDPDPDERPSRQRELAWSLTPEPFLGALHQVGIDVDAWLHRLLTGSVPGVVHEVLARHLEAGGPVWTVNYDELIENATDRLCEVAAWPGPPCSQRVGVLHKPHGTLGGDLIATSRDVLTPLGDDWRDALAAAVEGRVVVFVGYSGLDFDFHPLWDDLLQRARYVVWFDFDDPTGEARKRRMLPELTRRRGLSFPPSEASDPATRNPSVKFLQWWRRHGLADLSNADICSPVHEPESRPVGLPEAPPDAGGALLQVLSDVDGARQAYRDAFRRAPLVIAQRLIVLEMNHGGRGTARLLRLGSYLPRLGPLRRAAATARRKEITILANLGRHDIVLRRTVVRRPGDTSTVGINRAASMKMIGSLEEAASTAADAYAQARAERHPVRTANAAYQWAQSLIWAHRLDEAARVLDDKLEPIARVASGRWLAWNCYLTACLTINDTEHSSPEDLARAGHELNTAAERFLVEGLLDGHTSTLIANVVRELALGHVPMADRLLADLRTKPGPAGTYYTAEHPARDTYLVLLAGEIARASGDHSRAAARFAGTLASPYPMLAATGHLGLALATFNSDPTWARGHAEQARVTAEAIGARQLAARAARLDREGAASVPLPIIWV